MHLPMRAGLQSGSFLFCYVPHAFGWENGYFRSNFDVFWMKYCHFMNPDQKRSWSESKDGCIKYRQAFHGR